MQDSKNSEPVTMTYDYIRNSDGLAVIETHEVEVEPAGSKTESVER